MPSSTHLKTCYAIIKSLDDAVRNCWATKVISLLYKYGFRLYGLGNTFEMAMPILEI